MWRFLRTLVVVFAAALGPGMPPPPPPPPQTMEQLDTSGEVEAER